MTIERDEKLKDPESRPERIEQVKEIFASTREFIKAMIHNKFQCELFLTFLQGVQEDVESILKPVEEKITKSDMFVLNFLIPQVINIKAESEGGSKFNNEGLMFLMNYIRNIK